MDEFPEIDEDWGKRDRLLGQLDRMAAAGRVTEPEAARLREARDPATFGVVVRTIRVRHAEARLGEAVDQRRMSREEAEAVLERVRRGEHTQSLRGHLPGRLVGGHRDQPGSGSAQAGDNADNRTEPPEVR